jgi:hypothetical protein
MPLLALDGRAVGARSATTDWVIAQVSQNSLMRQFRPFCGSTHSGRFAATSPIEGEEDYCRCGKFSTPLQ